MIDYLTCPLEELPYLEPLRPEPESLTRLREMTHENFMKERHHEGWLSWQLTRPLALPSPSSPPSEKHKPTTPTLEPVTKVPVKKKKRK